MSWYLENGEDRWRTSDSPMTEEQLTGIESHRLVERCRQLEQEGWAIVTVGITPPRYIPPGLCGQHWSIVAKRDTPAPTDGSTADARPVRPRRLGLRGADVSDE